MKKITLIILSTIGVLGVFGILAIFSLAFLIPWMMMGGLQPNPPLPEITYGEFPFKLVYEVNGEQIIVEDSVICEFDGIGANEGVGKYRKWKSRLASKNENVSLIVEDNLSEDEDSPFGMIIYRELYFTTGSPKTYMGDVKEGKRGNITANAVLYKSYERGSSKSFIDKDELLEKYGIKLTSWEPSPPITNSFKD